MDTTGPSGHTPPGRRSGDLHDAGGRRLSELIKKTLFILLGSIFTGLAFLGIFLPLLPTTPFLLLAAFFFFRSSEKSYHWLLNHKIFGKYLQNYLKNRTIPINIKIFVLILLWITILLTSVFVLEIFVISLVLILIATAVTIHILSLKTLK